MIPFDFIYCRPETLDEAYSAYCDLKKEEKNPFFYAGGSEIITMSRAGSIHPGAVIDIKNIPECMPLTLDGEILKIGSVCTLNQIKESKYFPLMSLVCGRIADHTNQCRITIGGNLCGIIIYRETSLPLLLSDAKVITFGKRGLRTISIHSIFKEKILLENDEFIVQFNVPNWALKATHFHVKRTSNEKIDYPLVSMAAIIRNNYLQVAFSGVCSFPFRSALIESVLNDNQLSFAERAEKAAKILPGPAYSDAEASGEYRLFVFKSMVESLLEEAMNGQI
jgi:xanthine dehydrogenase FAD-binding subunit